MWELPNAPCLMTPVNTGNMTKREGASGTQTGTETAQNTAMESTAAC